MKKLRRGISPQYILGYAWFYGYKIWVNRGVLIPRFETEELVKWALENIKSGEKILDLGTGSGAIMVALVKQAQDQKIENLILYASDITDAALRESEENFLKYDLDVRTRKANVLVGLEKFDTIVSNPPYIKTSEKDLMDANVIKMNQILHYMVEKMAWIFIENLLNKFVRICILMGNFFWNLVLAKKIN